MASRLRAAAAGQGQSWRSMCCATTATLSGIGKRVAVVICLDTKLYLNQSTLLLCSWAVLIACVLPGASTREYILRSALCWQ